MAEMDFLTLAGERYSCRKFSQKPVEQPVLERILRAGQIAPTACNYQPQRVYVLQSADALEKLRRCTGSHFGAPLALLVCCDETRSWKRDYDGQDSGWVDASIVTTHMMLEAWAQGVGSTWVMHFMPDGVRSEFALPPEQTPVAILVLGYPAPEAHPSRLHADVRPLNDTVKVL